MTVISVPQDQPGAAADTRAPAVLRIALLGCGTVGSAFAALIQRPSANPAIAITHVLVRDVSRVRPTLPRGAALTADGLRALEGEPDVVVELLGGLEPARTLVLEALQRGIAVVTANMAAS